MKKILLILLVLLNYEVSFSQLGNQQFFPIAVWLQVPDNAMAYKEAGINLFIGLWNELNQDQLDKLKNARMYLICEQNEFGLSLQQDTTILAWMQPIDEPDNAQWNEETQEYDPCIDPSDIISNYNVIKSKDPSRLVYLNLGRGVSHLNWIGRGDCTGNFDMYKEINSGYIAGCDIVSFDIYPVNDKNTEVSENLWYVSKGIDSLKSWSVKKRNTWCWIETTKISDNSNRKPTTDEVKAEVWMAIIHGASGIGYFCHSWTPSFDETALLNNKEMIAAVSEINRTITSLALVLNSPNIENFASVVSSNSNIPIDIMIKSYENYHYIFAVSMRPGVTYATFNFSDINTNQIVDVLNENRSLEIIDGKFSDSFHNYEVHIYKITNTSDVFQQDSKKNINLYPIPANDFIYINFGSNGVCSIDSDKEIKIYNSFGECVMTVETALKPVSPKIDISHFPAGMYLIHIGNYSEKFLILK